MFAKRPPLYTVPPKRAIRGRRVYLRSPLMRDWRDWRDVRENSRAFLVPWEPAWDKDAHSKASFRALLREDRHNPTQRRLLIFRNEDGRLVGGVTLANIRRGNCQSASLGYWIGAEFARKGYMTDALDAVIDYAFGDLGLHRLEAGCLPRNAASRGVLEKLGFREEGYARGYLQINGRWEDHVLYGLLNGDPRP